MHGHHFWVLGHGLGLYSQLASNASVLNTVDPPFRDSYTVFKGGWTVIRFKARSVSSHSCPPMVMKASDGS